MTSKRRIVCAAVRLKDGHIVSSVRHFDMLMHDQFAKLESTYTKADKMSAEQGFLDNHGEFRTREQAYYIARNAGQIRYKTGNPNSSELFSEDLY